MPMASHILPHVLYIAAAASHSPPVIDMRHWRTGDEMLHTMVASQVEDAARHFGFFYVTNHGIPSEVMRRADVGMHEFFALPDDAKEQISADKTRALKTGRGYVGLRAEQLDVSPHGKPDLKEVLDLGLPLGDSTETYLGPNPWPEAMPQLQNATEPYLRYSLNVGKELLAVVARSVGLPEDGFGDIFGEPLVVQRLMRYPPKNDVNNMQVTNATGENVTEYELSSLGCGAHYDFGGLTLLRQADSPGLQVQPPTQSCSDADCVRVDGGSYGTTRGTFYSDLQNSHTKEWMNVDARPDSLVVTFGEALQRLTNGRVQATRHRVAHTGSSARHSMAVFIDPNPHQKVAPLPELVDSAPKYTSRIAGHKTVLLAATVAFQHRSSGSVGSYLGFGKV